MSSYTCNIPDKSYSDDISVRCKNTKKYQNTAACKEIEWSFVSDTKSIDVYKLQEANCRLNNCVYTVRTSWLFTGYLCWFYCISNICYFHCIQESEKSNMLVKYVKTDIIRAYESNSIFIESRFVLKIQSQVNWDSLSLPLLNNGFWFLICIILSFLNWFFIRTIDK